MRSPVSTQLLRQIEELGEPLALGLVWVGWYNSTPEKGLLGTCHALPHVDPKCVSDRLTLGGLTLDCTACSSFLIRVDLTLFFLNMWSINRLPKVRTIQNGTLRQVFLLLAPLPLCFSCLLLKGNQVHRFLGYPLCFF